MAFHGGYPRLRTRRRRPLLLGLATAVPFVAVGAGVFFLMHARSAVEGAPREAPSAAPSAAIVFVEGPRSLGKSAVTFAEGDDAPTLDLRTDPEVSERGAVVEDGPLLDEYGPDEEPGPSKPAPTKHFATVQDAATGSCSTISIEGLSKQIIAQARCLDPKAFVPLPARPNLVTGPHVFPYLRREAKEHLVRVLDAHKGTPFKIHSALRTVAQQYLVWRWSASKTCGVELATRPGESNHELGLALDIADHKAWRSALEAEQFRWLGASDRVHFDFKAQGPPPKIMMDVVAFQKLWNRNHPTERVLESGVFSPETEQRLKGAPADGFPLGPSCGQK